MIFIIRQAQRVYTPSSRPQSVEPSPERRSRSRGVTSELSTGESSRRAASSGGQESPTSRGAEVPDRQSLQIISTDTGSQNSRSECAPDTNQSNDDRTSIGHSNSPETQTKEEFGRHLKDVKDSALSQKASAKENSEKVPGKKKEELQEGHPSSLEETTPEDTTSSAKSGVNDENAQDDRPISSISHNKEPGSRPVEKSVLDIFHGLFVGFNPLARFNERGNRCIANTKEGNRCTRPIKQIDVSEIQRLLSAPYETERFNSELLSLVNLVLCGRSHREDVRKLAENLMRGASVDNETTAAATAVRAVEKQNKRRQRRAKPVLPKRPCKHRATTSAATSTTKPTSLNSPAGSPPFPGDWVSQPSSQKPCASHSPTPKRNRAGCTSTGTNPTSATAKSGTRPRASPRGFGNGRRSVGTARSRSLNHHSRRVSRRRRKRRKSRTSAAWRRSCTPR